MPHPSSPSDESLPDPAEDPFVSDYARRWGLPTTPGGLAQAREELDNLVTFFRILLEWDQQDQEQAAAE